MSVPDGARRPLPPAFSRFLTARAASLTAASTLFVALPLLVYSMTSSGGWVSAVVAAQGLPYLALGLVAGAVADATARKRVMVTAEILSAVTAAAVVTIWATGNLAPWHVLTAAVFCRSAFVFYDAANLGAVPSLVGRPMLARAQSALFSTSSLVELIVPAAAGALAGTTGAAPLLGGAAVISAISARVMASVPGTLSSPDQGPARRLSELTTSMRTGLTWLWRHRMVRRQTLVGAGQAFGQGAFMAAVVPWCATTLSSHDGNTRGLAVMYAAWAAGGLAAAITLPRLVERWGEVGVSQVLSVVPALGATGAVFVRDVAPAAVVVALWGFGSLSVMLTSLVLRQRLTPDFLLSRVNTTGRMAATGIAYPAGAALVGLTLPALHAPGTFAVVAAALALMALAHALPARSSA